MPKLKEELTSEELEQLSAAYNTLSDVMIEHYRLMKESFARVNRAFIIFSSAYANTVEPTTEETGKAPN